MSLDGVAFIDPRRSEIDVVQAVGRAIRSAPDKKVGTIILPVFISNTEDPDTALNDSAFKTVWEVLKAMRAHDEDLAESLDDLRRQLGRRNGGPVDLPRKVVLDLPARVTPAFAHAVKVRLVEQTTASWEYWFALLEAYVEREGHARMPVEYREGEARVGRWLTTQRKQRASLSRERQERLEALPGWTWDEYDSRWNEAFAALMAYANREGHARVPSSHVEGDLWLGMWVLNQRQRQRRGRMLPERRDRLEALPGWTWDALDASWEEAFAALTAYVEREGHARVPKRFLVGDLRLGLWVLRQRRQRELVAPERRERLEALPGWTWDPLDAAWEEGFACLSSYVDREGNARVPWSYQEDGFQLGAWVGAQRRKRGSLAPDLRDRLEALPGWTWGENDTRWEEAFAAVAAYVEKVGHARVPQRYRVDGFTLGQWVSVQRRNRTALSSERRQRLEALPGWVWDAADAKWREGLAALTAYAQREGHARVPTFYREGDFELGQWVASQRQRRDQMPGDLRERLEAVPGWTWSPFDARWEEAFAALTAYVEREGHARVPSTHREGELGLGQWVANQRQIQRRGRLSRERRERLEALPGWTWDENDTRWEEAFAALKAYVDREGHARVPTSHVEDGFRLGLWVANQRQQQRRGRMLPERRDRLEALPGWTWRVGRGQ